MMESRWDSCGFDFPAGLSSSGWSNMKRTAKTAASASVIGLLCLLSTYWIASQYWTERLVVVPPEPPEKEVVWTGTISTTNGWEFKLRNVLDFARRDARHIEFCKQTRQLFIAFGDQKDDTLYQWDVDKCELVHTYHVGKGFHPYEYAISPAGKYLIIERMDTFATNWETLIFDVEKRTVVRELGNIGCWFRLRFSADGQTAWAGEASFRLDGTLINGAPVEDFRTNLQSQLWYVGFSKDPRSRPGLYYRDSSGDTNLLTHDCWHDNYWITKDAKLIVAANWHDEIVLWDAESLQELARQRITNHHNGGGYIIYDEPNDRFLIADPSYQGTTFLRELSITKRPSPTSRLADKP
jgi:hypothetical protein